MSDSKKTKEIQDLRARLGRAGKPASVPPGSVPPGVVSPRPAPPLGFPPGSPFPGAAQGPRSQPPGLGTPLTPPPGAVRAPFAPTSQPGMAPAPTPSRPIVAPPFAQQPAPGPAPAARPRPTAPFESAAPAPPEKRLTVVVDDTALKHSKRSKVTVIKNRILLVMGFAGGVALGLMMGTTSSESKISTLAAQDEQAVLDTLKKTSKPVSEAGEHMQQLASGLNAQKIDYNAVESLIALKRPMAPNAFYRRFFVNFKAEAVDDLFCYANNVDRLWGRFTVLGAKSTGQGKREVLAKAATKGKKPDIKYGLAIRMVNEKVMGGLVFMVGDAKKKEDTKGRNVQYDAELASRLGGKTVTKTVYSGQSDFVDNPGTYAFMVNKNANKQMLGEPPNLFIDFKKDVDELNDVMQQTLEIQGRLLGKP